MLYQTQRHTTLQNIPWNEPFVRQALQEIVTDTEDYFDAENFWPFHPLDRDDDPDDYRPKTLYFGAAGVILALQHLSNTVVLKRDYTAYLEPLHQAYQIHPDTENPEPGYYFGESGILLLQALLRPNESTHDLLFAAVRNNISNPTNEAMWAAPGSMLAALFMYEATGQERWQELFLENSRQLWSSWVANQQQVFLWTQNIFGSMLQFLGPIHGFAGNVFPLLKTQEWLSAAQRNELLQRTTKVLKHYAQVEADCANWPHVTEHPAGTKWLLQWCHGAPGMIAGCDGIPPGYDPDLDELFCKAGELIWRAGPLAKGSNICHGTAGNGYAFLKLYRRTNNALWLDRARAFAMHAIEQCREDRKKYGRGRHSLWTGDLGLAVYLQSCLDKTADIPSFDTAI